MLSLVWGRSGTQFQPTSDSLANWIAFWDLDATASMQGRIRFQRTDLLSIGRVALEQITPDDFRLRSDSAGYRAGPDGKDAGADIDFVGPGDAYERWKKTSEYQQWLKDSGQVK